MPTEAFHEVLGPMPLKIGNFQDPSLQLTAKDLQDICEQIIKHPAKSFTGGQDENGVFHAISPLLDVSTNHPRLGGRVEEMAESLLGQDERREQQLFSKSIGEHLQTDEAVAAGEEVNNAAVFSAL